ncbi:ATP-binding protein [Dictyobacter alpinus]|uniref:ATP-binding protein n=1 Tax=Dictyobacter alpinus TaxID=2014873 RepID=UPI000F81E7D1|nr:ATP-binding protein [Dictyobacter alpinus]
MHETQIGTVPIAPLIGIPPKDLPYVFDRFYRADSSRTRLSLQAGGSGLGLSIAREIVEAHGGKIAIRSSSGIGIFIDTLPSSILRAIK